MEIPNLSGVADPTNIEKKGSGRFQAEYINWSRTLQDVRDHAPGWTPELVENFHGEDIWTAPDGSGYLKIRWCHTDGTQTVAIPHAIMDHSMKPIPGKSISARDISDGFVRGACKSAAALFGYAWQMWSKDDPMVRGDHQEPTGRSSTIGNRTQVPDSAGLPDLTGKSISELGKEDLIRLAEKATTEEWQKAIADAMSSVVARGEEKVVVAPEVSDEDAAGW